MVEKWGKRHGTKHCGPFTSLTIVSQIKSTREKAVSPQNSSAHFGSGAEEALYEQVSETC